MTIPDDPHGELAAILRGLDSDPSLLPLMVARDWCDDQRHPWLTKIQWAMSIAWRHDGIMIGRRMVETGDPMTGSYITRAGIFEVQIRPATGMSGEHAHVAEGCASNWLISAETTTDVGRPSLWRLMLVSCIATYSRQYYSELRRYFDFGPSTILGDRRVIITSTS